MGETGNRSIHDGFATIRAGGKRGRARSSSTSNSSNGPSSSTCPTSCSSNSAPPNQPCQAQSSCPGCCGSPTGAPVMEPLWEERTGGANREGAALGTVARRDQKHLPWWELATRRSRYRSCPAFSQANIVSALEQTVSDVTDRLDRLASSPDLKNNEAEELRRSAAILRRQSSAVSQSVSSGYFSLERQASCDSVSSVSSSISNATHISFNSMAPRAQLHQHNSSCPNDHNHNHNHINGQTEEDQSKIKKRGWLRASFRKAFGKNGRKRNKSSNQFGPGWDSVSSSSGYQTLPSAPANAVPQPPVPSHHYYRSCNSLLHRGRHTNFSTDTIRENRLQKSSSGNDSNEALTRLQQMLVEKERLLVESKSQLSDARTTIQTQTELINKLQIESTFLKEENIRLNKLVQNKFGTDANLVPVVNNLNSMTLANNSAGIYATLSPLKGKKVKIVVVENLSLASPSDASSFSLPELSSRDGGMVEIMPKTTWTEMDMKVSDAFESYCLKLDPSSGLGLTKDSLLCYRIAEALRASSLPKPDLLPYGYCVGSIDSIHLWLKGPRQKCSENPYGSVCSLAFEANVSITTLQQLSTLLHETRRVVVVGPELSGKSDVARQVAKAFTASRGKDPDNRTIVSFTVNGNNSLDLCHLLSSVWPHGRSTTLSSMSKQKNEENPINQIIPEVIIIDDLHTASGVVETLQRCLPSSISKGPAIVATCQNAPSLVTRMQVHCAFRWVGFSIQEEPVRGMLSRILLRPLLGAEQTSGMTLPAVHKCYEWLNRLWLHINSLLPLESSLGPKLLSDCPMDQEEAKVWFENKWNDQIGPRWRELARNSGCYTDPKDWVVNSYPWKGDKKDFDRLISLKPSDLVSRIPASPSLRNTFTQRTLPSGTTGESIYGTINSISQSQPSNSWCESVETTLVAPIPTTCTITTQAVVETDSGNGSDSGTASTLSNNSSLTDGATSQTSTNGEVSARVPPPSKIPKLGTFTTFVSTENDKEAKRRFETFTPIAYRREYSNRLKFNGSTSDFGKLALSSIVRIGPNNSHTNGTLSKMGPTNLDNYILSNNSNSGNNNVNTVEPLTNGMDLLKGINLEDNLKENGILERSNEINGGIDGKKVLEKVI